MKTTAVIAEYNPFHNGHAYHIRQARAQTGAGGLLVVMSGDYVQRGAPAVYNKYVRTRMALLSGADLVLEMPVFGSVASAEDFASCGVSMAARTGAADFLSFGSESGDLKILESQAALYGSETPEISVHIREGLRRGLSWPRAREEAFRTAEASVAVSPNDILACEYLRAIRRQGSSMLPVPVERSDGGYHSSGKKGSFASATAIRRALEAEDLDFLAEVVPEAFFSCLSLEPCPQMTADDLSMVLNEKLLTLSLGELTEISGMPEDLARKLHKNRLSFATFSDRTAASKDRQYTYARVSRCLLNTALGITREETERFKALGSAPWLRILGFRRDALPLLSEMKKRSEAPMITKTADAASLLSGPALELFYKHLQCAELYRLAAELKTGRPMRNEFTRSPVII